MNLPFLKFTYHKSNFKTFVNFWSDYYVFSPKDYLYTERINKIEFSKNDIEMLFEWKNGMKVNEHIQKRKSINKVVSKLVEVNKLKKDFNILFFNEHFSDLAAIWKIFLLHIIQPTQFPIFDQHVYRAHVFLLDKTIGEIPKYQVHKLNYYFNNYLPFFNTIKSEISDLRLIDLALWSFGKFLKSHYAKKLLI